MNKNIVLVLLAVLLLGVFLVGCTSSQTDYATYNQPQQQQYVGGGCGVAPASAYENTPIETLDNVNSVL
ncbi:hypothetical protein HYW99_00060 [Candidatus Woesearchaeota archaeon]|nr:hypothetical protein [Candidatus Woesearchaeota archaeon]